MLLRTAGEWLCGLPPVAATLGTEFKPLSMFSFILGTPVLEQPGKYPVLIRLAV
jgi:hypothetical protein